MSSRAFRRSKRKSVVLNIGIHQKHLSVRETILSGAGFPVVSASVEEALAAAAENDVRLAIFGHLVHPSDRLKISIALRRRSPQVRLVVMYDDSARHTEAADAVLQINVPPADLVHTVQYLLSGGATSVAATSG
ncbi:hypothetical protein Acid345_3990 [Candidatus Koribacter versatilis Ellin345]|uniref:Response regulatory domain-containing protein n=1 Tax=Koribacter versatilis (strain Ellin345) TaxID=204669 RepID=Q1IJG0_KORVE|nr:hypothetical protein [Candidatus Koribacter versatilis]ABF42990.1 hypothetical protein Acid345_3990 [Candidatus Koribacter versatilis Ellin345]